MKEDEVRQQLVEYARLAHSRLLVRGSGGNFSARLDESRMLITPTGVSLGDTKPGNLVEVDIASYEYRSSGHVPSKEYRYHADILRLRPDVGAVLHAHPPHVTAFAVRKRDIPMLTDAAFKQRPVPRVPFAASGSEALQRFVVEAIVQNPGCQALLLEEHGLVALGTTVVSAFYLADLFEELAHIASIAAALQPGSFNGA
jgi:L-fuculose-phosphate aldolase